MIHLTDTELWDIIDGAAHNTAPHPHLAGCAHCTARLHQYAALDAQLASLPVEMPSTAFTEGVLAGLEAARKRAEARRRTARRLPFLFLGLMCALGLGVAVVLWQAAGTHSGTRSLEAPLMDAAAALAAAFAHGRLLDGLLFANALLLLWLFNQQVLNPRLVRRMAAVR